MSDEGRLSRQYDIRPGRAEASLYLDQSRDGGRNNMGRALAANCLDQIGFNATRTLTEVAQRLCGRGSD